MASSSAIAELQERAANLGPELTSPHALMSHAMIEARRARMKVENDREALANRIHRLQQEEVRATRRIEQTHRRTQEILNAKDRHRGQQEMKKMLSSPSQSRTARRPRGTSS